MAISGTGRQYSDTAARHSAGCRTYLPRRSGLRSGGLATIQFVNELEKSRSSQKSTHADTLASPVTLRREIHPRTFFQMGRPLLVSPYKLVVGDAFHPPTVLPRPSWCLAKSMSRACLRSTPFSSYVLSASKFAISPTTRSPASHSSRRFGGRPRSFGACGRGISPQSSPKNPQSPNLPITSPPTFIATERRISPRMLISNGRRTYLHLGAFFLHCPILLLHM